LAPLRPSSRCERPGAIYAWPGKTRSPCTASLTEILHRLSSRCEKERVKPSGMCCTIRMPGQSEGICIRKSLIASVPPVEAPTMISFSLEASGLRIDGSTVPPAPPTVGVSLTSARMRACDAARTLSAIMSAYSCMPLWIEIFGLVTKSTAPSSSARKVISEPRSVSVDTMSTGIGRKRISFSRNSRPTIFGISTSSVRTSGLVCLIRSRAASGSGATPTTSMSGWLVMISFFTPRISAESSTIRTLIFVMLNSGSHPCRRSEQIDLADHLIGLKPARVVLLAFHQRVIVELLEFLHEDLAGLRKEIHLARVHVIQVLRHHTDVFRLQEIAYELGIAFAHVHAGEAAQDVAAAEHLGLEIVAPGARLAQLVDQHLHGICAIAHRCRHRSAGIAAPVRQHEVIHAADSRHLVPDARRDAGAEHGNDQHGTIGEVILARQYLGGFAVEGPVVIQIGRKLLFDGRIHACFLAPAWREFSSYTVLPRSLKASDAYLKFSECPANSSPSGFISGTKRSRIRLCVGLSK